MESSARAMPPSRIAAWTISVALALGALWLKWGHADADWLGLGRYAVDIDVYAAGGRAVLDGHPIYDLMVHGHLPFTYSPFAAVLFVPFALMPIAAARVLLLTLSVLAYASVCLVFGRQLHLTWQRIFLISFVGLSLEPFIRNTLLAQINLLLLAMVATDTLWTSHRRRGWLVGLAAGIKIVPGAFVLYFLLRRKWRSAAQAVGGFLISVAVGFLVSPEGSWRYWSGGFLRLQKFGIEDYVSSGNQSLLGVWTRVTHDVAPSIAVSMTLCIIGTAAGLSAACVLLSRGREPDAVVAVALGSLLGSPISWTHHWVWIVPALLVLAARMRAWIVVGVSFIFWLAPMWALDVGGLHELQFSWWQEFVAATYVVTGSGVLGMLAGSAMGWRPLTLLRYPRAASRAGVPCPGSKAHGEAAMEEASPVRP